MITLFAPVVTAAPAPDPIAVLKAPVVFADNVFTPTPVLFRFTIVLAVFKLVAEFAAVVADATFDALCPPMVVTTVALCVPVTSPDNDPLKFVAVAAVVAVLALVAVVAVVALPFKLAVI